MIINKPNFEFWHKLSGFWHVAPHLYLQIELVFIMGILNLSFFSAKITCILLLMCIYLAGLFLSSHHDLMKI